MMRDRLIELIGNLQFSSEYEKYNSVEWAEHFADHLLENGVIVPPCNVGQNVYRISNKRDEIYGPWEIVKFAVYVDEMGFEDDSDNWIAFDEIGKTVFLTKEAAKAKLKGGAE